jgi:hypothetical protein
MKHPDTPMVGFYFHTWLSDAAYLIGWRNDSRLDAGSLACLLTIE